MTPNSGNNPIIINEYCCYWLNRDGSCTTLSKKFYEALLGKDSTTEQRRHMYARMLAAKTEFWRSHRACAGVMEFCRPRLFTSRRGGDQRPFFGRREAHPGA